MECDGRATSKQKGKERKLFSALGMAEAEEEQSSETTRRQRQQQARGNERIRRAAVTPIAE
jgi:hypothetical protein